MAKDLEDRVSELEEKVAALSTHLEGDTAAGLKKMKRQIRSLKDRSKKVEKDLKTVKTARKK